MSFSDIYIEKILLPHEKIIVDKIPPVYHDVNTLSIWPSIILAAVGCILLGTALSVSFIFNKGFILCLSIASALWSSCFLFYLLTRTDYVVVTTKRVMFFHITPLHTWHKSLRLSSLTCSPVLHHRSVELLSRIDPFMSRNSPCPNEIPGSGLVDDFLQWRHEEELSTWQTLYEVARKEEYEDYGQVDFFDANTGKIIFTITQLIGVLDITIQIATVTGDDSLYNLSKEKQNKLAK